MAPTDTQVIRAIYDMLIDAKKQAERDSKDIDLLVKQNNKLVDGINALGNKLQALEKLVKSKV